MKSLLATIASLLLAAAGIAQAQPFAYITNQSSNNVSVINTTTNTVVATVVVGTNPYGVAVNPAGTRAYVANQSSNNVSVIDTATNTVVATVNVGASPVGVAVNPAGTRVYVTSQLSNNVVVINTSTNTVVATVAVGVQPNGVAVNPAGTRVYVTNVNSINGNTVSVIDTATNTVLATVAVGTGPFGVAVNPAGTRAYVANQVSNNVSVIDTATNTVVATVAVGLGSRGVAVNPAGTRAYVANTGSSNVSVIDTATNSVVATVAVGVNPLGVAVNPAGTRVYVTNSGGNSVSVIDTATNTVVATVAVGTGPFAFGNFIGTPPAATVPGAPTAATAVAGDSQATVSYTPPASNGGSTITTYTATSNPGGIQGFATGGPIVVNGLTNGTAYTFTVTATNGIGVGPPSAPSNSVTPAAPPPPSFAYITNQTSNNVSVINTATNTVVATVPVGSGPRGVAVNPAGTRAYVANGSSGNVSVIDTATNTVVATVTVGASPLGVAVNPAGTRAYVVNQASNNVSVIDTATNSVVATVAVGTNPLGVAVNPAGTRTYVTNQASNNVSVIDTATNSVVATVSVGVSPLGVAVNPAGTRAYVANQSSGNVSVIDTASDSVVATVVVGTQPQGVAVNPAGTRAYVANGISNNVSVIDTATNTVVATVAVGTTPLGVAVNPAGTRAYVANNASNTVSVIDTATNTVITSVVVGTGPFAFGLFIGTPPVITVPGAPTAATAVAGDSQATVSYTAPASNGGSTILSYTATSNPGGIQGFATGGPIIVNGLTNGTAYTFTVSATNGVGVGPPSAPSNSVTPAAALVACQFIPVSGSWIVPANWSNCAGGNGVPAGTPGTANRADIFGKTAILPTGTLNVGDINLSGAAVIQGTGLSNSTLNVVAAGTTSWGTGSYTFKDMTVAFTSSIPVDALLGTLTVDGSVLSVSPQPSGMLASAITITGTGAKISNGGIFALSSSVTMTAGGVFENNSTGIFFPSGPAVTINGSFVNQGTFLTTVNSTITLANAAAFSQPAVTGFIVGDGAISAVGQVLTVANGFIGEDITFTLGTLNNTGAVLAPGGPATIGRVTVNGNYVSGPAARLEIEIAVGDGATIFDQLVVSGLTTLTGSTVDFNYINIGFGTYVPTVGDLHNFLVTGTRAGTFAGFTAPASVNTVSLSYFVNGVDYVVTAPGGPAISVTGTTTFPSTAVGASSGVQAITITNNGTGTLTVTSITHSNASVFPDTTGGPAPNATHYCGFGSSAGGVPNTGTPINIAPAASCVLNLIFSPNTAGALTGSITVNSNAPTSPTMIAVSGTGLPPPSTITPVSIAFGNVPLTVPITQTVTFNNPSALSYTITALGTSDARFTAVGSGANPCNVNAIVAPAGACTFSLTFTPNGGGAFNNTTTVSFVPNGDGAMYTRTQPSNGTGFAPPASVTPSSVLFGNVVVGTPASQSFVFTNDSNTTLFPSTYTLTSFTTGGLGFTAVGSGGTPCAVGLTLAPGASCGATITFLILVTGASNGTTTIGFLAGLGSNPAYSRVVASNGTGVLAPTTPSLTVAFAPATVAINTNAALTLTLTNPGASSAFISSGSVTIPAGLTATPPGSNTCGTFGSVGGGVYSFGMGFIPAMGSCTIVLNVQSPTAAGYTVSVAPGALNAGGANTNTSAATLTVTAAPVGPFAYVPNFNSFSGTTVSVIDTATNTVVATVTVGAGPVFAIVNSAGTRAYIANQQGNSVSVIDTATNTVVATVPVGSQPAGIAVNPAGTRLYAPNQTSNNLTVIDTTTNTVVTTIAGLPFPVGAVVNPAGSRVYVTTFSSNAVAVIDTATNAVIATIPVCASPFVPVINPTGTRVYVDCTSGSVSVIDTATNLVVATVPVGTNARGIAINPAGTAVYVANNGSNTISVISTATNTVTATVASPGGPFGGAFNPAGTRFYVANGAINSVSVFDTATNTLVATVPVGLNPFGVGIVPGAAAPAAGVALAPALLNFGVRTINTTSPAQTVTLTNSGTLNLVISSITGSGDFGFTSTCPLLTPPLPPAAPCAINVTFTPLTVAALSGTITVTSNAPGSPHTVALAGTGSSIGVPNISLAPTALNFGAQAINTASFVGSIVVSNTGFANLIFSSVSVSGPFSRVALSAPVPPDCGASLAPGSSCQIGVVFSPTSIGAQSGQISIIDNAAGSPRLVPLSGTGTVSAVSSIAANGALAFGDQILNTTSAPQNLTISNTGAAPLIISAITLIGTNAADFTLTGQSACTSIAPAASCTLAIAFLTTTVGFKTAQVNITSNAQNGAVVTTSLTGNGILAPRAVVNVTTTTIGFGNVIFGGAAPNQAITLTNSGGQALSIGSIVLVGDFVQMNNCGTSLAAQATCILNIVFTPLAQGVRVGELILTTNAATSPNRIPLSGTGCRWFSQSQSRLFLTSC